MGAADDSHAWYMPERFTLQSARRVSGRPAPQSLQQAVDPQHGSMGGHETCQGGLRRRARGRGSSGHCRGLASLHFLKWRAPRLYVKESAPEVQDVSSDLGSFDAVSAEQEMLEEGQRQGTARKFFTSL